MSLLTKLFVLLYPFVSYFLVWLIFRLVHVNAKSRVRTIDIWTFFLAFGLDFFMQQISQQSILGYYILLLSGMGLALLLINIFYNPAFKAIYFVRRFWRITYLITLVMYLCLLIAIFFL